MHQINYLTTINFGVGALETLGAALLELGVRRPLVISDRGIEASGLLEQVMKLCPAGTPAFLDVPTNPTEDAVVDARHLFVEAGCDGVIAFGGGSPIDLAKGVALLATHDRPLAEYAAVLGGIPRIGPVSPVIAIPTTAGTGSEVGRAALITLNDGRKLGFISGHLIPARAICDPMLTINLPAGLTAATGLDALSHCIETFLSPRHNPPAEAIALDGFARIWNNLEGAVFDGKDIAKRTEMMMGALQGGLTFQKGLGAVHALSHALGGLKELKLHHGTLNAILMPPVLRMNHSAAAEKIARLSSAVGLPLGSDLPDHLDALNRRLAIPKTLSELGVSASVLDLVVERALEDHSHQTNPRPLSSSEYLTILNAVF